MEDGRYWIEERQRPPALSICQPRPHERRQGLAKTTTPRRPSGVGGAKAWRAPQRRAEEQALHGGGGSGELQRPGNHEPLSPILSHPELVLVSPASFLPLGRGPSFLLCVNAVFFSSRDARGRPPPGAGVIGKLPPFDLLEPLGRRAFLRSLLFSKGPQACLGPRS